MGLSLFSKAIRLLYLTLIPITLPLKLSEKLNPSGVLDSNFESKVQSKANFLHFSELVYLISTIRLNILSEVIKCQTYSLNSHFESIQKTKNWWYVQGKFPVKYPKARRLFAFF